eukprot:399893_1
MWIYIALLVFGTLRFADGLCTGAYKISFEGDTLAFQKKFIKSNNPTSAADECQKKCKDKHLCNTFKLDTKRIYAFLRGHGYWCKLKAGSRYKMISKGYRISYHVGCNAGNEKGKYSCLEYRVKYTDPDSVYTYNTANVTHVEDCYDKCNQQSQCIHFSYNTWSRECYMYGYSKAGKLFTTKKTDDNYISANKPCWDSNTEEAGTSVAEICGKAYEICFHSGDLDNGKIQVYKDRRIPAAERCRSYCKDRSGCETFTLDTKQQKTGSRKWYYCYLKKGYGFKTIHKNYRMSYHVGCDHENVNEGIYRCLEYRVKYKDPESVYTAVANFTSVEDCYDMCNQQSQCMHFSFETLSGVCYMYGYSKAGTLFTKVEDVDSYISANKTCWDLTIKTTGRSEDVKSVSTVSYEMILNAPDSWPEDRYGRHWGNIHDGPPP